LFYAVFSPRGFSVVGVLEPAAGFFLEVKLIKKERKSVVISRSSVAQAGYIVDHDHIYPYIYNLVLIYIH
jgi:hypothetical protein